MADDFTGASDAASFLTAAGVQTVLVNGTPKQEITLPAETRAVVVALKSRTAPVKEAVQESLEAFAWLKKMGAAQLYLKYCSTFDSTDQGNIGPVVDAVMERYGYDRTVLCPSLPVNGRTVKNGILYVNGVKLEESSMKDHPLTSMRKSRISDLMEKQGKYPCMELGEHYELPLNADTGRCYLVPDYYEEEQGDRIAEAFGNLPFLTGGSGLVGALGRRYVRQHETDKAEKVLLLAGSCSAMTLQQITQYQQAGHPSARIIPAELLVGSQNLELGEGTGIRCPDLQFRRAGRHEKKPGTWPGAGGSSHRKPAGRTGKESGGKWIYRIIVAGGETSGAVTKALGYDTFLIGESVNPGVPVMTPLTAPEIRLVLKSGNFGKEDFFERAVTFCRR